MALTKIIISDIDDVITLDRAIDERAVRRIKKITDSGIKVALATANTETRVREAILPTLEKHGLVGKVPVFCEFGLYEVNAAGKIFSPEANSFSKARESLLKDIYARAREKGMNLVPDEEAHLVTIKINAPRPAGTKVPTPEELARTRVLIEESIARVGLESRVHLNQTKRGFDVIPAGVDKSLALKAVLRKWNLKEGQYKGFSYGDQFRDRKMAIGKKMKFVTVIEANQFLEKTSFMKARFLARGIKRQWAGAKRKLGPKGRKILGIAKHLK